MLTTTKLIAGLFAIKLAVVVVFMGQLRLETYLIDDLID
jgi:hypothetical protein